MFLKVRIGLIWADWQTPHLSKTACIVGRQIHELAIFSLNGHYLNQFGFSAQIFSKFAIWG